MRRVKYELALGTTKTDNTGHERASHREQSISDQVRAPMPCRTPTSGWMFPRSKTAALPAKTCPRVGSAWSIVSCDAFAAQPERGDITL
jgi:hypothetical protein